ncbi:MAG: hypothetical protein AVDCRST_MAG24-1079, partial [uncultured Nocardioidaceae bacterium]
EAAQPASPAQHRRLHPQLRPRQARSARGGGGGHAGHGGGCV